MAVQRHHVYTVHTEFCLNRTENVGSMKLYLRQSMASTVLIFTKFFEFFSSMTYLCFTSNLTKIGQKMWQLPTEVHLRPSVQCNCRWADFRVTRVWQFLLWRTIPNFTKIRVIVLVTDRRAWSPHKGHFFNSIRARNQRTYKVNEIKENLRKIIRKIATLDICAFHCCEWQDYGLVGCDTVKSGMVVPWTLQQVAPKL
jgi:hypothetical protein